MGTAGTVPSFPCPAGQEPTPTTRLLAPGRLLSGSPSASGSKIQAASHPKCLTKYTAQKDQLQKCILLGVKILRKSSTRALQLVSPRSLASQVQTFDRDHLRLFIPPASEAWHVEGSGCHKGAPPHSTGSANEVTPVTRRRV